MFLDLCAALVTSVFLSMLFGFGKSIHFDILLEKAKYKSI